MATVMSIAKALVAAVIAGLSCLAGFLVNNTSFDDITAGQWVTVAIAFFVALAAVWAVPYKPASP